MEVQLDNPGGLRRELRVRLPAERVSQAVDERLKGMARRAKVPGFRPGKAPMKVILQQYGDAARLDAVSDLVNQTYPEALREAGVAPAGQPRIDITAEKAGEPLEYVAHIEVYPEITLQGLDALKIERPEVTVTDADVDRLVENLRKSRRSFEPVERAAEQGDTVTVDFVGKLDGEPFGGSEGKDVRLEIGAGQFLPDLEAGMVGKTAPNSFTVDVAFPADYRREDLQGKTAQFDVVLKKVEAPRLPDIDAEFLKSHNVDPDAGESGLRDKCRQALEKERDKAVRNRLKQQVMDQLLAANPIEVPEALITQETPRLQQEAAARMGLQNQPGFKVEQLDQMLPAQIFAPQAQRRVALGLLIGEVMKSEKIELDAARVDAEITSIAADYEQPEQVRQYYQSRPDLLQGLRAMVLEEQVVDALLAKASPTAVSMSLDALLQPPQPAAPSADA